MTARDRIRLSLLALPFLLTPQVAQQVTEHLLVSDSVEVRIVAGTLRPWIGVGVRIRVMHDAEESRQIDVDDFAQNRPSLPTFIIKRLDGGVQHTLKNSGSNFAAADEHIGYFEHVASEDEFLPFSSSETFLESSGPVRIRLNDGSLLVLTPETLKRASMSKLRLSEEDKLRIIQQKGGSQVFYDNKFDFGLRADNPDSVERQFYANFSFSTLFAGTDWWNVAGSGTLSSDPKAPFSELTIYPLSLSKLLLADESSGSIGADVRLAIGFEGDQSLKHMRFVNKAALSFLAPNFVNLSSGHNRLRLKPVVTLSAEYWSEIRDVGGSKISEATYRFGGEIYYFIPVQDRYSILIEGEFGGVFGEAYKVKYSLPDIISKFDVMLGYQLPDESLKVIAKYSFGRNDVTGIEDRMMLVGLLVGLVE